MTVVSYHSKETSLHVGLHLSDEDMIRIKILLDMGGDKILEIARTSVFVNVSSYITRRGTTVDSYVRAKSGQTKTAGVLGKKLFDLTGVLIAVASQGYEDSVNQKLSTTERLGRASTALLLGTPPFKLLKKGLDYAGLIAPESMDKFSEKASFEFFNKDGSVPKITGNVMWNLSPEIGRQWIMRQTWVDLFVI